MNKRMGLRVLVMDADYFALRWLEGLVLQDYRVAACIPADSPHSLLSQCTLRLNSQKPDLVLLSAEYSPHFPALADLVRQVRAMLPEAFIICLLKNSTSQAADLVRGAVEGGAHGLFIKEEISYGLVTGALRASNGLFLHTPGVRPWLEEDHLRVDQILRRLPAWRSVLPARLREAFELTYFYGMTAAEAASRMGLSAPNNVHKYLSEAYRRLHNDTSLERDDFAGVELDQLDPQLANRLLYTALPAAGYEKTAARR